MSTLTVLDGGMGTTLILQGVPRSETLWSAIALAEDQYHRKVINVHKQFIAAGAQVITTSNYGVGPMFYKKHFEPIGEDWKAKMWEHTELAAKFAREAVNSTRRDVKVYGCLPPIETYRPDIVRKYFNQNPEEFKEYYSRVAQIMAPYVDVFLLETMSSIFEVKEILDVLPPIRPVGVVFYGNCLDPITLEPHPPNAQRYADFILQEKLKGRHEFQFYGLNCARIEEINSALLNLDISTLRAHGLEVCVYPNCVSEEESSRRKDYDRDAQVYDNINSSTYALLFEDRSLLESVKQWVDMGVTQIGGCCGFRPHKIKQLAHYCNNPYHLHRRRNIKGKL